MTNTPAGSRSRGSAARNTHVSNSPLSSGAITNQRCRTPRPPRRTRTGPCWPYTASATSAASISRSAKCSRLAAVNTSVQCTPAPGIPKWYATRGSPVKAHSSIGATWRGSDFLGHHRGVPVVRQRVAYRSRVTGACGRFPSGRYSVALREHSRTDDGQRDGGAADRPRRAVAAAASPDDPAPLSRSGHTRAESKGTAYRDYLAILMAEEVAHRAHPHSALYPPGALLDSALGPEFVTAGHSLVSSGRPARARRTWLSPSPPAPFKTASTPSSPPRRRSSAISRSPPPRPTPPRAENLHASPRKSVSRSVWRLRQAFSALSRSVRMLESRCR